MTCRVPGHSALVGTLALLGAGPGNCAFLPGTGHPGAEWAHQELGAEWATHSPGAGGEGGAAPAGDSRHPFWHFEGHHLANYQAYVCGVVLFMAGVICAAGGIGGGGIYVTLLMVAGKLGITDAVPLAKAIVFLGSISSWLLNSRKLVSWETKRETAIDYNICRLMVPGALSGTLVGVILNRRMPSWIILTVLSVILVVIAVSVGWTTLQLFLQERAQDLEDEREEAEAMREAEALRRAVAGSRGEPCAAEPAPGPTTAPALLGLGGPGGGVLLPGPRKASVLRRPSMNAPDVTKMRNRVLRSDMVFSLGMLVIVIVGGVLRFHIVECLSADLAMQHRVCRHPALFWLGRSTLESWIQHSHVGDITRICTISIPFSLCIMVEVFYARLLVKHEGWRLGDVAVYCATAVLTGCLSGLVGIGGGLIFSPFLLVSGVHPSVAVATSSTCVVFTSASTSLQYLFTDRIIVSLTVVYGIINLIASYLGTSFVHFLEEHFWGRKSYISAIVGVGVLISTVLSITKLHHPLH